MGLILSARRAGSTQASSPAPSITADVTAIQAANDTTSSAGRPVGPPPSATNEQHEAAARRDSAPHQHHGVAHDSREHMAWVGAERHTHPDFARPPRHADRHQREESHGRQKQHQRADSRRCRDWRDQPKIPLPDRFAEWPGFQDGQSGIDTSRNHRQTSRQCCWIAAQTHTHDERRHRGGRRGVKHIRGLVALLARVQAEIPHHADDFERRLRG